MTDKDAMMQKVISSSYIEKYLDGTYSQVGGYVTRLERKFNSSNTIYDI